MTEIMPLDTLSNIEGATFTRPVEQLFETLRNVDTGKNQVDTIGLLAGHVIKTDDLREDVVVEASDIEKQIIMDNFPNKKEFYLVVPKVIEE